MTARNTARGLAFFFLIVGAVGCSNIQQPKATITGMDLVNPTAQGFTLNFKTNVENPNPFALPVSQADYKLALSGVKVIDGKAKPAASIPAKGASEVTVPITLTYENLLAAEQAIAKGGGAVGYSLNGGLQFGGTGAAALLGQAPRVPLNYEGTLNLRTLLNDPQILLQSPAAKKLAVRLATGFFDR